MDSNYKDYVLKELDNLVSQMVEASEFKASESYRAVSYTHLTLPTILLV